MELVLDLAGRPAPGAAVLDFACGSGRFLIAAGRRWPDVALRGFETDPAALEAARAQLPGATLHARDFLAEPASGDVDLVVGNPPYVRDRGRKRDLYVDFIERGLDHLRDGGRLALVLSNAWLDVGYGRDVRELLLDRCAIEWIVESAAERWFPGAKVNTMVLVVRRCADEADRAAATVRLAEARAPLPAMPTLVRTIEQRRLGRDEPWGPLLRAPDLYLERLDRTAPLGELAAVERGWTTNDNGFFYPPPDAGIEPEWLRPLLKSPTRTPGVRFCAADLRDRVFVCPADRAELEARGHRGALAWIDRHERSAWRLRAQVPARLFAVKGHHDRLRHPLADRPVQADQQLYLVRPKAGLDDELLAALMASSWAQLALELTGRVNFGDGVLWLGLADARLRLRLPDPGRADAAGRARLRRAFEALPAGPLPPVRSIDSDPVWGPALRTLDAAVAPLLGLDEAACEQVRAERLRLCRRRLEMAASAARAAPSS